MCHFNSKLAKEVGRLTGWREKIFGRRYQAVLVSPEEADRAHVRPDARVKGMRFVIPGASGDRLK